MSKDDSPIKGRRITNRESDILNYRDINIDEDAINEAIAPFIVRKEKPDDMSTD